MYYIYKIINLVNNKIYIGKTKNINKRFKTHIRESFNPKSKKYNRVIHCAIRKYGPKNFIVEYVDSSTFKQEIDFMEKFYIQKYNSRDHEVGYNIALGGDGGWMGVDQSGENNPMYGKNAYEGKTLEELAEISLKKSLSLTGKKRTDEQKENYSKSKQGKLNPQYGKFGKDSLRYGKKHSAESKEKMSLAKRGKYGGENNPSWGKHWYNNGKENYYGFTCPEGYVCGIIKKKKGSDVNEES